MIGPRPVDSHYRETWRRVRRQASERRRLRLRDFVPGVAESRLLSSSPDAVGMGAGTGKLAAVDDQIFLTDRTALEPAFENFARSGRVTGLRRQGSPRRMRGHAMMRHRPPGMVRRRRLRIPDIAGIPGQLPALQCANYGIAITNPAARRVHQIGAALHLADQGIVEQVLGLSVQWRVDCDYVAHPHQGIYRGVVGDVEFLLDRCRKPVAIGSAI